MNLPAFGVEDSGSGFGGFSYIESLKAAEDGPRVLSVGDLDCQIPLSTETQTLNH